MEILKNPFFWIYISGAAAGCSLGYMLKRISKDKSGSTGFALLLSVSLLAFSSGILCSPGFFSAPGLLILPFAGAAIIGFLIGRFPIAAAPPVLLILGSLYLLVYFQIQGESGIPLHEAPFRISVLRFNDAESILEVSYQGKASLVTLNGEELSLEAEQIVLSPYVPWVRQEYLFAKQGVPGTGDAVPFPDFHKVRKFPVPLELSDSLENLGLLHKERLRRGPLYIRLLHSYTIDHDFFKSEPGV